MEKVISRDGTPIAYDRSGTGPALILVAGALTDRADMASLASLLSASFTVFNYDRRGRGDSGDTQPYAVERELEDLDAVISAAGEPVFLYGHSSGAVLALRAAGLYPGRVKAVVAYEPPFIVDSSRLPVQKRYIETLRSLDARGQPGEMVKLFLDFLGMPESVISRAESSPDWPGMESKAHTLIYDMLITKDGQTGRPLSPKLVRQLAANRCPTLILAGEASQEWARNAARAVVQVTLPGEFRLLEGQTHNVADQALFPVLVDFFLSSQLAKQA